MEVNTVFEEHEKITILEYLRRKGTDPLKLMEFRTVGKSEDYENMEEAVEIINKYLEGRVK